MSEYTLHCGDCLEILPTLEANSVHCCVTSPPYFGLRDYGHADQIGLEPTPDQYVAKLVEVFRHVWRVLRDDGTLWLNLGDSYSGSGRGANPNGKQSTNRGTLFDPQTSGKIFEGLKPKDLIGIPWRVAFALQADGWYLRSDIIWHKPNPMPESVRDRPTKAHEQIFLLSKSPKYYYDAEAVSEPATKPANLNGNFGNKNADARRVRNLTGNMRPGVEYLTKSVRNRRSVWTVTPKPFRGAHFAVMPPALVEPCILAGCPVGGTVLDPFAGSGTVGAVALNHGRRFVGVELSADYCEIARRRIDGAARQLRLNPLPLPAWADGILEEA